MWIVRDHGWITRIVVSTNIGNSPTTIIATHQYLATPTGQCTEVWDFTRNRWAPCGTGSRGHCAQREAETAETGRFAAAGGCWRGRSIQPHGRWIKQTDFNQWKCMGLLHLSIINYPYVFLFCFFTRNNNDGSWLRAGLEVGMARDCPI